MKSAKQALTGKEWPSIREPYHSWLVLVDRVTLSYVVASSGTHSASWYGVNSTPSTFLHSLHGYTYLGLIFTCLFQQSWLSSYRYHG